MKTKKLSYLFLILLIVPNLFPSCNGQVSTSQSKTNTNSTNLTEQLKIVRSQGIQSGNVVCQLLDKDGNLWFSIIGEGAYRYDGRSFTNFTISDGLCNNNVVSIIQDSNGSILIGTKSGICKYDGRNFAKYPVPDSLNITCMLEDKDGNLWFGTMGNGIYRYNGTTLDNFLNNEDSIFNLGETNQLILDILQDKKGNLWFSSWNGGGVWRFDGKIFTNFLPPKEYYLSNEDGRNIGKSAQGAFGNSPNFETSLETHANITDDMIFSIAEDKGGNLWFATRRHGVCRFDGKSFKSFNKNEGFVDYGVYSILEDKKGNMWFATEKNGVYRYDGKTFKNYSEKDGLVNNAVVSILEDKKGDLWFGTKWFGLSRYDGKTFATFSQYEN